MTTSKAVPPRFAQRRLAGHTYIVGTTAGGYRVGLRVDQITAVVHHPESNGSLYVYTVGDIREEGGWCFHVTPEGFRRVCCPVCGGTGESLGAPCDHCTLEW